VQDFLQLINGDYRLLWNWDALPVTQECQKHTNAFAFPGTIIFIAHVQLNSSPLTQKPRVGSGVVRIDPLHFRWIKRLFLFYILACFTVLLFI